MNFSEKLYSLLTARSGVIKYSEFFSIIETLLNEEYKKKGSNFISSGLVVTRWISEGFIEADTAKGGFKLKRPSLYSCGSGKWVYVGARFTPAINYLKDQLESVDVKIDAYDAPKLVLKEKKGFELNIAAATRLGCDVYGSNVVKASDVLLERAGSISTRTFGKERDCDQPLLELRWFLVNPKDFSLNHSEVGKLDSGHYILRNHGNNGKPIWRYIKLLSNNKVIELDDWRWLYVSLLSESAQPSQFFYEPNRECFCIIRITGPYTRQENWLPRELAEALGSASEARPITTKTVQDVDGMTKTLVVYPNVKLELALKVHEALGMNRIHPLRYLQF